MRRALILLLVVWMALLPPVSSAAMSCTHPTQAANETPAAMHHHAGMTDADAAAMTDHASHASSSTNTQAPCSCGFGCTMTGCIGTGPGIAAVNTIPVDSRTSASFISVNDPSAALAAHTFGLIRPPSRS